MVVISYHTAADVSFAAVTLSASDMEALYTTQ